MWSASVLRVCDMFHPVDGLAILLLLNGDVAHGSRRNCAMPVLLIWRKPDHVTRTYLFDRSALSLRPTGASCNDERLPERMSVPRGAGSGFERHGRGGDKRRVG